MNGSSAHPGQPPDLSQALDRLWERFLPEILARAATLERAASSAAAGSLSEAEAQAAQEAAHKLAGVLGTFGLDRGTELARGLENCYARGPGRLPIPSHLQQPAAELRSLVESRKQRFGS